MAEQGTSKEEKAVTKKKLMVAAIDFGTTYSGWAYSFENDYKENPIKSFCRNWSSGKYLSSKAPTAVLVKPDGETLEAFGYEAEEMYATLVDEDQYRDYYYFKHFKMTLYNNKTINRKTLLEDDKGKKLPAQRVFAMVIRYLKENMLEETEKKITSTLDDDEIQWVLTVPAIWEARARQFMRECAMKAGIKSANLLIALEPEAASLYCKYIAVQKQVESEEAKSTLTAFQPGTRYMVIDAGGGTIDIVVHEVTKNGVLEEIYAANGGNWGGTSVDNAFFVFLSSIVGEDVMRRFREEHMDDYLDLQREFELKKRDIKPSKLQTTKIKIPPTLLIVSGKTIIDKLQETSKSSGRKKLVADKLMIDSKMIQECFQQSIDAVVRHVKNIFLQKETNGTKFILMVGGYSESAMLFEAVRDAFPDKKVIIPEDPGLSVLKGAVIFGHNMKDIAVRVSQYTYGYAVDTFYDPKIHPKQRVILMDGKKTVHDAFKILVQRGEKLTPHKMSRTTDAIPPKDETGFDFMLYASKDASPAFVDDPGCLLVGNIYVDCRDDEGNIGVCNVYLTFGGTEFVAYAEHKSTGKTTKVSFDFMV